jgi:UDP-3-O-[3-hydroxymyristoyl] glucosamine N-acyltransferase
MISLKSITHLIHDFNQIVTSATNLGFAHTQKVPHTLTFVDTQEYAEIALNNSNVSTILWSHLLDVPPHPHKEVIVVENPRYAFLLLQREFTKYVESPRSEIHRDVVVPSSTFVDNFGVTISSGCTIGQNVVIHSGTFLGPNVTIGDGCVIGADSMYPILNVNQVYENMPHLGKVKVGSDVFVGSKTIIDRAVFAYESTTIEEGSMLASSCNISHGVQIGKLNRLAAGVRISGYTTIGDNNWFGPGSVVSNLLAIGSRNSVAIGSVLAKSLNSDRTYIQNKDFDTETWSQFKKL